MLRRLFRSIGLLSALYASRGTFAWAPPASVTVSPWLTPGHSSPLVRRTKRIRETPTVRWVQSTPVDVEDASLNSENLINSAFGVEHHHVQQTTEPDYQTIQQTLLNGVLLAVCFGYAAYTILDVDHGMTRGWTQAEIAMRIPLDNWASYENSLAEKPIYTKTLINVVIYLLGDWLSQTAFQGKNVFKFDAWRTLRNGFIGLCFGPLVHEYYQFSDHILPVEAGIWNRIQKIMMDQTIYLTVKCSIYIMAVGLLQGESLDTVKQSVKDRIGGIVLTAWKFWPLVHCVTYGLIPARHRVLWVNCVDLIWSAILASMTQKKVDVAEEVDVTSEAAAATSSSAIPPAIVDPFLLKQDILPESEPVALFDESPALIETSITTSGASNSTHAMAT